MSLHLQICTIKIKCASDMHQLEKVGTLENSLSTSNHASKSSHHFTTVVLSQNKFIVLVPGVDSAVEVPRNENVHLIVMKETLILRVVSDLVHKYLNLKGLVSI